MLELRSVPSRHTPLRTDCERSENWEAEAEVIKNIKYSVHNSQYNGTLTADYLRPRQTYHAKKGVKTVKMDWKNLQLDYKTGHHFFLIDCFLIVC